MTSFHPDLLPESADPAGSTRSYVTIMVRENPADIDKIVFTDLINTNSLFIVDKFNPQYSNFSCDIFDGVVLKEKNNSYSWWKRIKQERVYPTVKYEN